MHTVSKKLTKTPTNRPHAGRFLDRLLRRRVGLQVVGRVPVQQLLQLGQWREQEPAMREDGHQRFVDGQELQQPVQVHLQEG